MAANNQDERPRSRMAGLIAGLAIAVGYLAFDVLETGDAGPLGTFGLPTVIAGSLGGWIFGPAARTSQTDRGWAGVIVGLAVTSVVIAAVVVGIQLGLAMETAPRGFETTFHAVLSMVSLTVLFGVPTFGLFMLPLTIAASAIWALVMVFVRPGRSTTPG